MSCHTELSENANHFNWEEKLQHNTPFNQKSNVLSTNLFNTEGHCWKLKQHENANYPCKTIQHLQILKETLGTTVEHASGFQPRNAWVCGAESPCRDFAWRMRFVMEIGTSTYWEGRWFFKSPWSWNPSGRGFGRELWSDSCACPKRTLDGKTWTPLSRNPPTKTIRATWSIADLAKIRLYKNPYNIILYSLSHIVFFGFKPFHCLPVFRCEYEKTMPDITRRSQLHGSHPSNVQPFLEIFPTRGGEKTRIFCKGTQQDWRHFGVKIWEVWWWLLAKIIDSTWLLLVFLKNSFK